MAAKKVDDIPFEDEEDPEDELTSMSESYRRRSIGDIEDAPAVRAHCVLCCVVLCASLRKLTRLNSKSLNRAVCPLPVSSLTAGKRVI